MTRFPQLPLYRSTRILFFCYLCLAALFFNSSAAQAQTEDEDLAPIRSRHYTTADGLPDNSVNSILQDEQGFMWLATDDGLVRFDGYHFVEYGGNSGGAQDGFESHTIESVYEDSTGVIWVATLRGTYRYDVYGRWAT